MTDYTYLDNYEWIVDLNMLQNPSQLDGYLKDTSIKLFNPNKSNLVTTSIVNKFPNLSIGIDNTLMNSDRVKIYEIIKKSTTLNSGGYYLINGLIKMQNRLLKEETDLINILDTKFSADSIKRNLLTETYDTTLVFKNVNTKDRDIPMNIKYITKFVDDTLENYDMIENELLENDMFDSRNYKDIVKNSVISTTTFETIDLNKACIGSIDEIVEVVNEYFNNLSYNTLPPKINKYINSYISIYIKDEKLRKDFTRSIYESGKYIFINAYNVINKLEEKQKNNKTKELAKPIYPRLYTSEESVKIEMPEPRQLYARFLSQDSKIKNGKQLLTYIWTMIIIEQLKQFTKQLNNADVDKKIIQKILDSYESLRKFFQNSYAKHYGLSGGNSPYHVDDIGIDTPIYNMDNTVFMKNISESMNILKYNGTNIELTTKDVFIGIDEEYFKKIFFSKVKTDAYTKKDNVIGVGGIIMIKENNYSVVDKSVEVLRDYYNHLLKNKKINIEYINEIQKRMEKGIHRNDVNKIIIEIRSVYKMIANSDILIKDTLAKAAGSMLAAYLNTMLKKNFEIISKLITIDSSVETMSTMNNPDSKIYQKLLIEKSKLILDLLYTQYKVLFFESVYERYYTYMSNNVKRQMKADEMPQKNIKYIKGDIEKIMKIWNKKLTTLKNQDLVNVYKNYASLRLTHKEDDKSQMSTSNMQIKQSNKQPIKQPIQSRDVNIVDLLDTKTLNEIMSDNYWSNNGKMYNALGGKTNILVPYVNSMGGHGFINIFKLAKNNKKSFSWKSDCTISGQRVTKSYLANNLKNKGWTIVGNTPGDVDDSKTWRCLILEGTVNKIKSGDIRVFVYKLLMQEKFYLKNTNFTWPDTSNTKLRIMNYCDKVVKSVKYSHCYILVSRVALYNLISGNM